VGKDRGQVARTFGMDDIRHLDGLVENVTVEEKNGAESLTSTGSVQGFWVDAETLRSVARYVMNSWSSGTPNSRGWRLW
jgi:hypothetical protein